MKRFLPYILIVIIALQMLAPFSVGVGEKKNFGIKTNLVEADDAKKLEFLTAFNNAGSSIKMTSQHITDATHVSAYFTVLLDTGQTDSIKVAEVYDHTFFPPSFTSNFADDDFVVVIKNKEGKVTGFVDATTKLMSKQKSDYPNGPASVTATGIQIDTANRPGVFSPETDYSATLFYQTNKSGNGYGQSIEGLSDKDDYIPITSSNIHIGAIGYDDKQGLVGMKEGVAVNTAVLNPLDCDWTNFKGCVAMVPYYLLFMPTSAVFSIAGKFFDFTFGYSVQDKSYRSAFVVEGWGIIRDFCNMFFIFILLYIAFGTILNIHGVKTKEMIINVVIIGLLINFSLFVTYVIIDASNILARVFYNSETIKINQKNADGSIQEQDSGQFIKLSEAIVSKVNPQELVLKAGQVGVIPDKGGMSDTPDTGEIGLGTLILVILLSTAVNIVGIIVFVSVGLIFVTRVIGLWLAMIFVPLTFLTYAVPSLQDLDMVGWKKWWPETIKLAFLAPVFVFFMYLIIKFLDMKLDIINTAGKTGMDFVVAILLPFAFIMILLWKAKDIAKKMSGTMGEMAVKAGSAIGGVALGAGIGAGAMAMRGTVGRLAANAAQSNKFKDWAGRSKIGASALKMTSGVASSSFDARATKLGGMAGKGLGVDLGKAKEGGFTKVREEKVKKEEEFANKLLDTSDYGIAELTSGKMSANKANSVVEQMNKGRDANNKMTAFEMGTMRAKLVGGNGLDLKEARKVADQMNSARREDRAKKFENSTFMTNRIKANKIRKSPQAMEDSRKLAQAMASLAAAQKAAGGASPTVTTPHAQPTSAPSSTPPSAGAHTP